MATSSDPCPVEECEKNVFRGGYCYGHYMKNWRYGTPTPQHGPRWVDLRGQRFGTLTVTDEREGRFWICQCDCGQTTRRTSHHLQSQGDTNTCGIPGRHYRTESPGYTAAHDRVRNLRGVASLHKCIDCGDQADHWSYDHADEDELFYEYSPGHYAAYSAKPEHYQARCVPCHKRFDLDRLDSASAVNARAGDQLLLFG